MNKLKSILFIFAFYSIFIIVEILTAILNIIQIKKWFPKQKRSILYFENFPIENAGYQYRAKKWSDILNKNDLKSKVITTVKEKSKFEKLINQQFSWFLIRSMLIRLYQLIFFLHYETIIVRRELLQYNDYGNLFMEKLLFSIHANVILDFDDDIAFAKNESRKVSIFGKFLLERPNKFTQSLKLYSKFMVCSEYLETFILKKNFSVKTSDIAIIPTCVEISNLRKAYTNNPSIITLGWIGGNGNQKYLDDIIDDLNKIYKNIDFQLNIVSGKIYKNSKANFKINNYLWSIDTQEEQMLKFDIGLMPLRNTNEDKGKCGFKLLQYMSLGLVSLASPITINREIIEDKENAFLISENWEISLKEVIQLKNKWAEIGRKAKKTFEQQYSFSAHTDNYIKFVEQCVE